jgi:hypothetical protein
MDGQSTMNPNVFARLYVLTPLNQYSSIQLILYYLMIIRNHCILNIIPRYMTTILLH